MPHPFSDSDSKRLVRILDAATPSETGCRLWPKSIDGRGYGQIMLCGKLQRAHRASYMLRHDCALGASQVVMHLCDTPCCVNPDHLRVGTQAENMADCRSKGRNARGEANGQSLLTEALVVTMREEWAAAPHRTRWNPAGMAMEDLAVKYGLSGDHSQAAAILRGDLWKHAGGPLHKGRDFLTDEQVRAIRATPLTESAAAVARTLGISKSAVCQVRGGKSYQHVVES